MIRAHSAPEKTTPGGLAALRTAVIRAQDTLIHNDRATREEHLEYAAAAIQAWADYDAEVIRQHEALKAQQAKEGSDGA